MATKRAVELAETQQDDLDQARAILSDDSFTFESITPALDSLYAEMGVGDEGESNVYVTLLNVDGTGKEANIWRGPPEDYDLERLAKQFGSGDYRVKIYVKRPGQTTVLKANKVFTWKLTAEEEKRRLNPQVDAPAFNPQAMADLIANAVRAAMPVQAPPPPPVNAMAQMREFAELMQIMRPPEPAPQTQNTLSSLRDMAELMDMLRGGNDNAPAVGSATGNDLMLKLIDKFGPLFMNVLASQQGAGVPAQPSMTPAAMNNAPTPQLQETVQATNAPAPATPPQPAIEDDVNIKLTMGLKFLCQQCDAGGMPETYAEVVLDSVPADAVQALINSPAPLDYLAGFEAKVKTAPYADWFVALIASCKDMLNEPPEEEHHAPTV